MAPAGKDHSWGITPEGSLLGDPAIPNSAAAHTTAATTEGLLHS